MHLLKTHQAVILRLVPLYCIKVVCYIAINSKIKITILSAQLSEPGVILSTVYLITHSIFTSVLFYGYACPCFEPRTQTQTSLPKSGIISIIPELTS